MHFNANFTEITLLQWAPICKSKCFLALEKANLISINAADLNDALGVPLAQLGKYLLAPAVIEQFANVGAAAIESLLLRRGVERLTLRRLACVAASGMQALGMLAMAAARSPMLVSAAMCCVRAGDCLHNSGYNVSYLEVGGASTALLSAVGNCVASAP